MDSLIDVAHVSHDIKLSYHHILPRHHLQPFPKSWALIVYVNHQKTPSLTSMCRHTTITIAKPSSSSNQPKIMMSPLLPLHQPPHTAMETPEKTLENPKIVANLNRNHHHRETQSRKQKLRYQKSNHNTLIASLSIIAKNRTTRNNHGEPYSPKFNPLWCNRERGHLREPHPFSTTSNFHFITTYTASKAH